MNKAKRPHRLFVTLLLALLLSLPTVSVALAAAGNIDAANKLAWGANVGWVNFAPDIGGVTVAERVGRQQKTYPASLVAGYGTWTLRRRLTRC